MAYNIKLDVFEGPLDLLLHLIKEQELDIYDIPIAKIAEQYFEYINVMKSLNLDVAGDYLVMAATLTYIKSRTLLPKEDIPEDDEEGIDPRDELVAKLLEYKKFKEAAMTLREKEITQSQVFARKPDDQNAPDDGELLLEVSVFELLKSFKGVMQRLDGDAKFTLTLEEISVTDKLNQMVAKLEQAERITFDSLFELDKNKMEVVASFLALLELLRLKLAKAIQARPGGEIIIYRAPEDDMDYDSEEESVETKIKNSDIASGGVTVERENGQGSA
ncbi:Segregation and condensation protein A [hydrothermal vent metagenome]|uniref:Segregation and condensation protein A n=1 Tax=hydrothermal vent metagenome TaxID=652676 RepID=A0A3B1C2C2_9ZZZZ